MGLLKKENWVIDLLLMIFSFGAYILMPSYQLDLFEQDKWYSNSKYWLAGILLFCFPAIIMLVILVVQMTVKIAKKMNIGGKSIYDNVYIWIALLITPVIGWSLLIVMYLYLHIFIILNIKSGNVKGLEK